MSKQPTKIERAVHAEGVLDRVGTVTIVLDNGERLTFSPKEEAAVPKDANLWQQEAIQAHERLAFWDWQVARARRAVRAAEVLHAKERGNHSLWHRTRLEETKGNYVSSQEVTDIVDASTKVMDKKAKVDSLRYQLELIVSIRDACEHRVYLLRKLLDQDAQVKKA